MSLSSSLSSLTPITASLDPSKCHSYLKHQSAAPEITWDFHCCCLQAVLTPSLVNSQASLGCLQKYLHRKMLADTNVSSLPSRSQHSFFNLVKAGPHIAQDNWGYRAFTKLYKCLKCYCLYKQIKYSNKYASELAGKIIPGLAYDMNI